MLNSLNELKSYAAKYPTWNSKVCTEELNAILNQLNPNESILCAFYFSLYSDLKSVEVIGNMTSGGAYAITNQRLIIAGKQMVGLFFPKKSKDIMFSNYSLSNINSLTLGGGRKCGFIKVNLVGGEEFRIGDYNQPYLNDVYSEFNKSLTLAKSDNSQTVVVSQKSSAEEIMEFKKLLDMGIISQEEFEAKKKQLLGL